MVNLLNKGSDWLNKMCEVLVVIAITALIAIMSLQVFSRFFLGHAITWADGTARYLLIWSTFLGATIATKNSDHISLTFLLDKLHGKGRVIGDCVVSILFLILAGVVVWAGIETIQLVLPQKSDSLPISVAWIYGAIPFCQGIIFYHLFVNITNKLSGLLKGELVEEDTTGKGEAF